MTGTGNWWSFGELLEDLADFERLLTTKCGIPAPIGRSLPQLAAALRRMAAISRREASYDESIDYREEWRGAVGLADLVRKTVALRADPKFGALCNHFRLLETADGITQNRRSSVLDSDTNKLFELLIALAVMPQATAIELDHPTASRGNNPDVIATIRDRRYGFACKVPHTRSATTYRDNVEKAIRQIDVADVDAGFVFLNLKNIIDHDELHPSVTHSDGTITYLGYRSTNEAAQAVHERVDHFKASLPDAFGGLIGFHSLFANTKARPVLLNYFATAIGITALPPNASGTAEPVTTVSIFRLLTGFTSPIAQFSPDEESLLESINRQLH